MDALKLLLIFALIILALRKKVSVAVTLFGAGVLTAILYAIPFKEVLRSYWTLVSSERFLSLTAVIVLVTILGALLKEMGYLARLTESCRALYGGRRTAATVLPPLVGMMPMPGGALLSAPLVDDVLSDPRYTPQLKCVINYWFRHTMEHVMPIYPGVIVAAAMTGIPMGKLALMQAPLGVVMIVLGIIFFIRKVEPSHDGPKAILKPVLGILSTIWPVIVTVAIYAIFGIPMALAALCAITLLVIITRPSKEILWRALAKGLSYKLVFLVFGILSFQTLLDLSGAVASVHRFSAEFHLPPQVIIIIVAFISGLLTGLLAGLVALSYSLLAAFLYQPVVMPGNILLAFISGYIGMMASPTHLCFVLTNDYFGSDLLKCLKLMVIPLLLLGVFGYFLSQSFWPGFVYP